jgi:hypothetical protein
MKKKSKTVALEGAHCWRSNAPGTGIFLALTHPASITLIQKDGSKPSGHRALWQKLDKYLQKRGR